MNQIKDHRVKTLICTYQYILNLSKLDFEAPFNNKHLVTDSITVSPTGMVLSLETTQAVTHIINKICESTEGCKEIEQSNIANMLVEIIEYNLHSRMYDKKTGTYYTHNTVNANIEFKYRHNLEYVKQIICLQQHKLLDLGRVEDKFIQLLMQSEGETGGSTMNALKEILEYRFILNQKRLIKKLYSTISELIVNTAAETNRITKDNINRYRRIVHVLNTETLLDQGIEWEIPSKDHESHCICLLELIDKFENSSVLIKQLFNDYDETKTANKDADYARNKRFVKQKCEQYYPELMKKLEFLKSLADTSYLTIYQANELTNKETTDLPEFTYD